MLRIRQAERPMGARLRLARAKCLPHPRPRFQNGSVERKEFRQVVPRAGVIYILGYQAGNHPLAWGVQKIGADDRARERVSRVEEEMQERLGRVYAAAMGG